MKNSTPPPPRNAAPGDPEGPDAVHGPGFAEVFRRRPARAPHGLVPGRRVWITLGWAAAVSATVTLSAVTVRGTVLDDDGDKGAALAADSAAASPGRASGTATPSAAPSTPSSSPSAREKHQEKEDAGKGAKAGTREEDAAGTGAGSVAHTATDSGAGSGSGSASGSGSGAGAGSGSGSGSRPSSPEPEKHEESGTKEKSGGASTSGSSGGSTGTTAKAPAQDFSRPLGAIVGRYGDFQGHCVQLAGSALKLYPCDGGADQQWQFAKDGTLRKNGRCLSLSGRSTNDGTRVVMAACDTTNVTQWRYSPGNDIVNVAADKCLDVANASTAAGTPLQIAWCSGNWAQKWNVP
jgi:hypothetical protein